MHQEQQYLALAQNILDHGVDRGDRTGTGTRSQFGAQMRFDLRQDFPLLTTKSTWFHGVAVELLWLLSGDTNIKYLLDNKVHIWDEWADQDGNLGPVYGKQWRAWEAKDGEIIDQIKTVIERIKTNPEDRRLIVSAWNVGELPQMALPPCHAFFQFYVANGELSCQLYQRSADLFLGVPFNIASYSLLTLMIAQITGLKPGEFVHTLGDVHIYHNHFEQFKTQLQRKPLPFPQVKLNPKIKNIDDFSLADIDLINYQHHPKISAPIAV